MAWTTPPTFTVGGDPTAANLNALSGDLAVLGTSVSLYGVSSTVIAGSLTGYAQPAGALIQAGTASFTYTNGSASTITFPSAFPNALIAAVCTRVGTSSPEFVVVTAASTVSALLVRVYTNNNTEAATGSKEMSWIAIGW